MRVVLDTNTLASGVLAHAGSPASTIVDAWREAAFILVVCEDILAELTSALAKPYFADRLARADTAEFLELLATTATLVAVQGAVSGAATHPEDDRILECAVVGEAAYLVTGDKKMQMLRTFQSVQIVAPRAFVEILAAASE
jgi:uncharacterized protein